MNLNEPNTPLPITIGGKYRFDYPSVFVTLPDYTQHAGQVVTVLRKSIDGKEYDSEGMNYAYQVRAKDGWEGMAWEEELLPIKSER